jgi:putative MATE family efflux protein
MRNKVTEEMQKQIVSGPIVKTLFVLGWPIMLTHFFQIAYNLIDTFWLGKLGEDAIAVPTLTWPMVFLFVSVANGLAVAGVALVSQYVGAKNQEEARRSAGQSIAILMIVGIALSLFGILISDLILQFMGPTQAVYDLASPYIRIIFASMPFMFIIMGYAFILRGWGDTRTPMYVSAFSVTINLLLDPILIFGIPGLIPSMGVMGAGIATFVGRAIGGVIVLYLLFRAKKTLRIRTSDMRLEKDRTKRLFKIGIPATVGQAMVSFGFVVTVALVTRLGTDVLATYGIGTRIVNTVFVIIGGLTGAAVTMIGQSLGADLKDRAGKVLYSAVGMTMLILFVTSIIFVIFSDQLVGVFIQKQEIIEEGRNLFLIFGLSTMFFGAYASSLSAFQGSGRNVPTMILGITRLWLMRLPLVYIFAFVLDYGAIGIWMGLGISNVTSAVVALAWVSLGKWKKGVVEKSGRTGDVDGVL